MTMQEDARQMIGFHVITSDDEDLGTVERVYLDNRTQQPEFVSVKGGGLFGRKESLVPLQGSQVSGDRLRLPFDKQKVKDAPDVGNAKDISPQEGERLYQHYGLGGTSVPAQQSGEADRMADGTGRTGDGTGDRTGDRTDAAADSADAADAADTADPKAATGADPRADAGADRQGGGMGMPAAAGIGTAAAAGVGTAAVAGVASHHGSKPDTPETGTAPGTDPGTDMRAGTDMDAGTGTRTGMDADAPSGMDPRTPDAPAAATVGHTGLDDPASDRMPESPADRTTDASSGLGTDAGDGHFTSDDGAPGGLSAPGAEPMAFSAAHEPETSGDAPAASAGIADAEHTADRTATPGGLDAGLPGDHGAETTPGTDPTAESAGMPGTQDAGRSADAELAGDRDAETTPGAEPTAESAGMAGTQDAGHSAEAHGDSGSGKGAALAAGGAGVALAAGGAGAAYAAHKAKSSDAGPTPDTADAKAESPAAADTAGKLDTPDTHHATETASAADTSAMADSPHAEHAAEMTDTAKGTEKSPDGKDGTDTAAASDAAKADAPAAADGGHAEHDGAPRTVAIPQQGIRLIREPIAEGEQLTEADHGENVIIVYAERLVVSTVRVPVERVRVVKAGDAGTAPGHGTSDGTSAHAHHEQTHDLSHDTTAHDAGSIS